MTFDGCKTFGFHARTFTLTNVHTFYYMFT